MRADSNLSEIRWHAGGLNNGVIFGLTRLGVVHLPRRCSYAIGHVGTWLAFRLMRAGTKAVVANLRAVRPDASELELRALALSTYRSYARDTIDFIGNLDMNQAELTRWVARHDDAPLRALLARGRGVIIAGGHFGNWELGGVMLRVLSGHPLLVPGAIAAVKQWRYRPYLLNGQPVEVETTITVVFSLSS